MQLRHVLVTIDGSPHSRRAIDFAADLAEKYGARLSLLHVIANIASGRVPEELRDHSGLKQVAISERDMLLDIAAKLMNSAQERIRELGLTDVHVSIETGNPSSVIVRYCDDHDVDLIVMGRRGLGDLGGLVLGSVSHKVAHLVDCACLTVA